MSDQDKTDLLTDARVQNSCPNCDTIPEERIEVPEIPSDIIADEDSHNDPKCVTIPEERIEVPEIPSDIIADEYSHNDNGKAIVCVFKDESNEALCQKLTGALVKQGYQINMFDIESRDKLIQDIDEITKKDYSEHTCFILIFFAEEKCDENNVYYTNEAKKQNPKTISGDEIWRKIMDCESLKYRPKICFFHAFCIKSTIETDSKLFKAVDSTKYNIPPKADMLIVYKQTKTSKCRDAVSEYFDNLCENLEKYAERDDLVNILSCTKTQDFNGNNDFEDLRPIVISTLRKKFFLSSSKSRRDWHDAAKEKEQLEKRIEMLQQKVKQLEESKAKKPSYLQVPNHVNLRKSVSSDNSRKPPPSPTKRRTTEDIEQTKRRSQQNTPLFPQRRPSIPKMYANVSSKIDTGLKKN